MVDNHTEQKVRLNFARLLIEVEMNVQLPDKAHFKNEKEILLEEKVQYE